MRRFDRSRDGKLSLAEISATSGRRGPRMQKRFAKADANRDGVMTRREFVQAAASMNPRRGRRGPVR